MASLTTESLSLKILTTVKYIMVTITLRSSNGHQAVQAQERCIICLDDIFDKNPESIVTCVHTEKNISHVYHRICLSNWANSSTQNNNKGCPHCWQGYGRVKYYKYNNKSGEYVQVKKSALPPIRRSVQPLTTEEKVVIVAASVWACLVILLAIFLCRY
jgi:hypothetical protein